MQEHCQEIFFCFFSREELRTQAINRTLLLCATSVFSVSLWFAVATKNNHRGTEYTEVAQRNLRGTGPRIDTLRHVKSASVTY